MCTREDQLWYHALSNGLVGVRLDIDLEWEADMINSGMSDALDDSAAGTTPDLPTMVSVDDRSAFSKAAADLADADVMDDAWR
jgi:hypothetical protein